MAQLCSCKAVLLWARASQLKAQGTMMMGKTAAVILDRQGAGWLLLLPVRCAATRLHNARPAPAQSQISMMLFADDVLHCVCGDDAVQQGKLGGMKKPAETAILL